MEITEQEREQFHNIRGFDEEEYNREFEETVGVSCDGDVLRIDCIWCRLVSVLVSVMCYVVLLTLIESVVGWVMFGSLPMLLLFVVVYTSAYVLLYGILRLINKKVLDGTVGGLVYLYVTSILILSIPIGWAVSMLLSVGVGGYVLPVLVSVLFHTMYFIKFKSHVVLSDLHTKRVNNEIKKLNKRHGLPENSNMLKDSSFRLSDGGF